MGLFNSEPQHIGKFLPHIIEELGLEEALIIYSIKEGWTEIMGEVVAKNVQPTHYSKGTLTLTTTSSTWRTEIQIRVEQIKQQINQYLNSEKIEKIIIR